MSDDDVLKEVILRLTATSVVEREEEEMGGFSSLAAASERITGPTNNNKADVRHNESNAQRLVRDNESNAQGLVDNPKVERKQLKHSQVPTIATSASDDHKEAILEQGERKSPQQQQQQESKEEAVEESLSVIRSKKEKVKIESSGKGDDIIRLYTGDELHQVDSICRVDDVVDLVRSTTTRKQKEEDGCPKEKKHLTAPRADEQKEQVGEDSYLSERWGMNERQQIEKELEDTSSELNHTHPTVTAVPVDESIDSNLAANSEIQDDYSCVTAVPVNEDGITASQIRQLQQTVATLQSQLAQQNEVVQSLRDSLEQLSSHQGTTTTTTATTGSMSTTAPEVGRSSPLMRSYDEENPVSNKEEGPQRTRPCRRRLWLVAAVCILAVVVIVSLAAFKSRVQANSDWDSPTVAISTYSPWKTSKTSAPTPAQGATLNADPAPAPTSPPMMHPAPPNAGLNSRVIAAIVILPSLAVLFIVISILCYTRKGNKDKTRKERQEDKSSLAAAKCNTTSQPPEPTENADEQVQQLQKIAAKSDTTSQLPELTESGDQQVQRLRKTVAVLQSQLSAGKRMAQVLQAALEQRVHAEHVVRHSSRKTTSLCSI